MKKTILCIAVMIVMMLSGCADKKNDVLLYVSDVPVTMAEYEFYLDNVKMQFQGTELSNDEDWQNKEIDGRKAIEVAKDRAIDSAVLNIAYIKIYEGLGKTISRDDETKIGEIKSSIVAEYSNDGYEEFLKSNNISDEFIDMLCKSTYCAEVLYNEIAEKNNLAESELDEYFANYIDEKMKDFGITVTEAKEIN